MITKLQVKSELRKLGLVGEKFKIKDVRNAIGKIARADAVEDYLREIKDKPQNAGRNLTRLAAQDPDTPPEVLSLLARYSDIIVKEHVALNRSTPPEILEFLFHSCPKVFLALAQNPSSPPSVLSGLAKKQGWWQNYVAGNPSTPPETLALLAKHKDEKVRKWVAKNDNTPPETLGDMLEDDNDVVRSSAKKNANTPLAPLQKAVLQKPEISKLDMAIFEYLYDKSDANPIRFQRTMRDIFSHQHVVRLQESLGVVSAIGVAKAMIDSIKERMSRAPDSFYNMQNFDLNSVILEHLYNQSEGDLTKFVSLLRKLFTAQLIVNLQLRLGVVSPIGIAKLAIDSIKKKGGLK